jgi:hypothetical protein
MTMDFTNPMAMMAGNNMLATGGMGQPMNLAEAVAAQQGMRDQQRMDQLQQVLPALLSQVDPNDINGSLAKLVQGGVDPKNAMAIIELRLKADQQKQEADLQSRAMDALNQPSPDSPAGSAAPDDSSKLMRAGTALSIAGGKGGNEMLQLGKFNQDQANRAQDLKINADKTKFEQENQLADDFRKTTQNNIAIRDAYQNLQSGAAQDNGAGDIQMVFAFMKSLDPNSTVREGEFATAENTAGIPAWVTVQYNKALKGERLSPEQRANFLKLGKQNFEKSKVQFDRLKSAFSRRANRYGLDPGNVTFDLQTADPVLDTSPDAFGYTPADYDFTAKQRGMTVDQVKALVAQKKGGAGAR